MHGGALTEPGAARRLQDPLSLRCVSQIHGSLHVALDLLAAAVEPELGGAADNPLVLIDDEEILSTGNFHVPALALALDATAIALAQVAATSAERQARLKTERLSGLPAGLSPSSHLSSGLSPLSKTAQALTAGDPPPRRAAGDPCPRSAPTAWRTTPPAPPTPRCACASSSSGCGCWWRSS